MDLDFGRVRSVIGVERATVSGLTPDGLWPCPSCDEDYDIRDGWKVTFIGNEPAASSTIVCPGCAEGARSLL